MTRATSQTFPQRRPWYPIFDRATRYGTVLVGNTPPYVDNPFLDVNWHSFYWADSTDMLGFLNGDPVTDWFDQIGSEDLTASTSPVMVTTDASFNNHKSVQWVNDQTRGLGITNTLASGSAQPVSLVLIAKYDSIASVNTSNSMIDGGSTGNRMLIRLHGGPVYAIFAGTTLRTGGTPNTNAHCFNAVFDGASTRLEIDGVPVIALGSAGTHSWDGLLLGYITGGSGTQGRFNGRIAACGVYFGDVETDPGWASFKAAVLSYYGISIA